MSQPSTPETTPIRSRRWFQFSLRTVLVGMVVLAVALGWLSDRVKLQEQLAQGRAEKEALRAARDYEQGAALNPWWIRDTAPVVSGGWQLPSASSGVELDEATVDHLKEYLGGEPSYQAAIGGSIVFGSSGWDGWGDIGSGYTGSTTILRDSVFGSPGGSIDTALLSPAWPNRPSVTCVRDVAAKDAAAIPALVKLLQNSDATMRARAACTLARLGPGAKEAVPALLDRLKDSDHVARRHAAYALGRIGDNSPAVLTALREAVDDDAESTIAPFAAQMLCRLDPAAAPIPRLLELLEHRHAETRRNALRALASVGSGPLSSSPAATRSDVVQAIPKFKKLCSDPDPATCKQAMLAVVHLVSPAEAHAVLGEIVRAGRAGDKTGEKKEVWTFASLLWNRLDRQMRATETP